MWKIYLFEFVITLLISILWAHLLSKQNNNFDDED